MLTQDFLQAGGRIQDLEKRYAIKAVRSTRHPSLILLKYKIMNDYPFGTTVYGAAPVTESVADRASRSPK